MKLEKVLMRKDMLKCVLCHQAPCDQACPEKLGPAQMLRSIYFDNEDCAALKISAVPPCLNCPAPCEYACVRSREVPIRQLLSRLAAEVRPQLDVKYPENENILRTDICGIPLENPFLLSSSVVASTYDMCARAFEAGWAGAAFKTICTMDIHEASPRFSAIDGGDDSIIGFKNIEQLSDHSVPENMAIFRQLKKNYPHKVILASIMGQNENEWTELAYTCQENGADVIELNFSCPNMMEEGLGSDIGQMPDLVERFTAAAKRRVRIPVLAKLTPNVATMNPAAEAAKRGGADGLAAINTIKSIMGVNPHTFVSSPAVHGVSAVGGYSGNAVKPIGLRFIAELGKNPTLQGLHISGMGGVETWHDALEYLVLGAGSIQVTTAVMQYGYRIIDDLKSGLTYFLHNKGIHHVRDIIGQGLASVSESTDVLERDTILFPKFDQQKCIGCGRCEISCADGGHQAIRLNDKRQPILNGAKCVGCHLCILICPQKAIHPASKRIARTK